MDPQDTRPGPTRTTATRPAPRSAPRAAGPGAAHAWRHDVAAVLRRAPGWRYLRGRLVSRLPWLPIGLAAGLLLVLLFALRQPLSERLWPQTRAQALHQQAARALSAGRLTAADGTGARELYEAALALDPDRSDARAGLNRVGQAALAQARAAAARQQYAQARQLLALAAELAMPRAQILALSEQLRAAQADAGGLDALIADAAAARAAGHLDDGPAAALPLYLRVLELQPDRLQALEGREDTLADLLQQAMNALDAGQFTRAAAIIGRVQSADPGHVGLPDALEHRARVAERERTRAQAALEAGQLAAARRGFDALRQLDPDDQTARRGLVAVATRHAQASERHAADFRFPSALQELRRAQAATAALDDEVPAVAQAQQHLARARQAQRSLAAAPATAQRNRRVGELLEAAARAQQRGDLLTPPGDSAFDRLRAANALAPDDPRVRGAMARLVPAAAECFDDALSGNRLIRAGACLDARRALEGNTGAVREGRRELARRWIARGNERLGAGELVEAQEALALARKLDPRSADLEPLAQRVRAATLAQGRVSDP
ncbi:hypothetical protein [Agrilutibacter solisilvae]|uniref:Tetratricopeptide repeat protein n=1 Tax=Agrilutibacter solisilvae TaxID=2763317 RepID=A0A974XZ71_9GAMM|nr:hypothetical protein [Lysobacter solisilvae]QSX78497.1 hypothetical protein I8J32_000620 [Lysobacter solisilvae]